MLNFNLRTQSLHDFCATDCNSMWLMGHWDPRPAVSRGLNFGLSMWMVLGWMSVVGLCGWQQSCAQEIEPAVAQSGVEIKVQAVRAEVDQSELAKYDALLKMLRKEILSNQEAEMQFYVNGLEASYEWKEKWQDNLDRMNRALDEFRLTACRIHSSTLPQPESLAPIIKEIADVMYQSGQYVGLDLALEKMVGEAPDDIELTKRLGLVYLKSNRFEQALDVLTAVPPTNLRDLDNLDIQLLLQLEVLIANWEAEALLREKEKHADDLPRVLLKTTCGDVVIELFENEAPGTVGNFVSLVESGHYDETVFHRVIENFMSQGGGFTEDNQNKRIGYTIKDECNGDNFRRHFVGSVSMAKTAQPDSGAAEFFITLVPTPFLDGKHTVFGRVIEGVKHYQRFAPTVTVNEEGKEEPIEASVPEKIISATVIRKRPHPYRPVKVE